MCAAVSEVEILARPEWQMSLGERSALEGLVAQLSPELAIEIGTAEGGSLARIAEHSAEVHAVDLTRELLAELPPNASFHEGDSRVVLPALLAKLAAEGHNVDFVLVDGDHSCAGVRSDLEALLASPAIGRTVLLLHDSFNPEVRAGIESAGTADHPKVVGFDIDFVPGRMAKLDPLSDQLLGGFSLIIVDADAAREHRSVELGLWSLRPTPILLYDGYETALRSAELIAAHGTPAHPTRTAPVRLDAEHLGREQLRRELAAMRSSWSWRITAPLRALRARVRAARVRRRMRDG